MKKHAIILCLLSVIMVSSQSISGYSCMLCNYGTIPIHVWVYYAGGPICPNWDYVIKPLKETGNQCQLASRGGCCMTGLTLRDPNGIYPEKYFGLNDYKARQDLEIMWGTGAGMACADTKFSFWNNQTTKKFQSAYSAAQGD